MAGRGTGKTRAAAEFILKEIKANRTKRVALVAKTPADARDVMIEGDSGLLTISPPWDKPLYEPSKRRLTWKNGTTALIFSSKEPDQLRGPQYDLCFAAGTMIATLEGERPIETIRTGDFVLTRKGNRKVIATSNRLADVGKIKFSNGAGLIATSQHPVLQLHGWTRIQELKKGAIVCTGTKILTDISSPIRMGGCSTNIGGYGSSTTGQYQKATKFTIKTKITEIITSTISNFYHQRGTGKRIARKLNLLWLNAKIAARKLLDASSAFDVGLYVIPVNGSVQRKNVKPIEYVKCAESHSIQESPNEVSATSVVSVVSIWEDVGQAVVYNLTVEDQHEYIANGIIVHNCWGDEIRTWYYPQETWDNLMFGLRLGEHPRCVVTTTPLPLAVIKKIMKAPDTVITTGTTYENRANLAPSFFQQVISKYEGTRLGRQEINAELLEDVPGALWHRSNILYKPAPELVRVVVAIDPAVTSSEQADETGIIVAGIGIDGLGYVLADRSARVSPDSWARRAVQGYDDFKGDRIIGEVNNGGEMVGLTIGTVRKNLPYTAVHASRGKQARAEPVAALYEQHRIFHTQEFNELEDQLVTWTPESGESPDRLDALVWAFTELFLQPPEPRESIIIYDAMKEFHLDRI